MPRNIPNDAKLTSFRPVHVPKVKDIFKRIGFRSTSQSSSGQVADFARNPLESFDSENRRMSQHYYDKYVEMMQNEALSKEEKSDDNQTLEDKESAMEE